MARDNEKIPNRITEITNSSLLSQEVEDKLLITMCQKMKETGSSIEDFILPYWRKYRKW